MLDTLPNRLWDLNLPKILKLTFYTQRQGITDGFTFRIDCTATVIAARISCDFLQHQTLIRSYNTCTGVMRYERSLDGINNNKNEWEGEYTKKTYQNVNATEFNMAILLLCMHIHRVRSHMVCMKWNLWNIDAIQVQWWRWRHFA